MIYSEIKDDFNAFLRTYGIWIAVGVAFVIALTILLIFFFHKKKSAKKVEDNTSGDDWHIALGGKENIVEANANGSRLTIKVVDQNKVDKEKLKLLGVSNIVTMSDKIILVLEDKAEIIKNKLA